MWLVRATTISRPQIKILMISFFETHFNCPACTGCK
uniref:Uncharacterized protein n=1 Tax=Anguilla anguilla TaxID=7936 RepID=A0A0E9UE03_ANGAN